MIPEILSDVERNVLGIKVFVGTHGDLDEGQEPVLITDAGTVQQAVSDVRSVEFGGGGDAEEHHLDGIEFLFNHVPWVVDRSTTRSALVAFVTADTKPSRLGKSPTQLGEEMHRIGLLFYLVCQPTRQLTDLCTAAQGMLIGISNDPSAEDIRRIAARLSASITQTVARGGTVPLQT